MALSALWQGCVDFDEVLKTRLCAQAEMEGRFGVCDVRQPPPTQFTSEPQGVGGISGAWIYGAPRNEERIIVSSEAAASLALSSSGERWLAGTFMGEAYVGTTVDTSSTNWGSFVAKLDAAGYGEWAVGFNTPGGNAVTRIAVAPGGDGFVTGMYQGGGDGVPVQINARLSLPDASTTAGFVLRFHPDGTFASARGLGGPPGTSVTSRGIAAGSDGVVVVGSVSGGDLTVDGTTVATSAGGAGESLFVVGLDTELGYRWHVAATGCTFAAADAVALDGADSVYVVGRGQGLGCVIGGSQPFEGRDPGIPYAFVARYSASGQGAIQEQWLQVLGQADLSSGGSIAVDGAGNLVAFINAGSAPPSGVVGSTGEPTHATLFKLSSAGSPLWTPIDVVGNSVRGHGLTADSRGNVWITGELQDGSLQIGGFSPDHVPGFNAFAAQLTPDARVRWGRTFGGTAPLSAVDAAVDPTGEAIVVGNFSRDFTLGASSPTLWSAGTGTSIFLLQFYP